MAGELFKRSIYYSSPPLPVTGAAWGITGTNGVGVGVGVGVGAGAPAGGVGVGPGVGVEPGVGVGRKKIKEKGGGQGEGKGTGEGEGAVYGANMAMSLRLVQSPTAYSLELSEENTTLVVPPP